MSVPGWPSRLISARSIAPAPIRPMLAARRAWTLALRRRRRGCIALRRAAPRRLLARLPLLVRPAAETLRPPDLDERRFGRDFRDCGADQCNSAVAAACAHRSVGWGGRGVACTASASTAVASPPPGSASSDGDFVSAVAQRPQRPGGSASVAFRGRSQPRRGPAPHPQVGGALSGVSVETPSPASLAVNAGSRRTLPTASSRPLSALPPQPPPRLRNGRRRRRPALDAVAQRAEHRREILAGAAEERRHGRP